MSTSPITIALAGSTQRTAHLAEALRQDTRFQLGWVLTPPPKPIGRRQTVTPNPLQVWAQAHQVSILTVENRIDEQLKSDLIARQKNQPVDILLVVDFGYLIPQWLLDLPTRAPLNVHPSQLPRWRGSSPGQFALLFGDTTSAVSLMVMSAGLDEGPLIHQTPFKIDPSWDSAAYYTAAFEIAERGLADWIVTWLTNGQPTTPQPAESPTLIARRLEKTDSYLEWPVLAQACGFVPAQPLATYNLSSALLQAAVAESGSLAVTLERAVRALAPWPGVWTSIPKAGQAVRVKILTAHLQDDTLVLDQVQLEGKQPTAWTNLKPWWEPTVANLT